MTRAGTVRVEVRHPAGDSVTLVVKKTSTPCSLLCCATCETSITRPFCDYSIFGIEVAILRKPDATSSIKQLGMTAIKDSYD